MIEPNAEPDVDMDDVESRERRPRTSSWSRTLPALAFVMVVCAVGLMVSFPAIQTGWLIAELEKQGAKVYTAPRRTPDFISDWIDLELPQQFDRVVSVDLMHSNPTDEQLQALSSVSELESLAISGKNVTSAGFSPLKNLDKLHSLIVIACPNLPYEMIEDFKKAQPKVKVEWRGASFLGVQPVFNKFSMHPVKSEYRIGVVEKNGPADKAGILAGDVISEFGGENVSSFDQLVELIGRYMPGETVPVEVERNGKVVNLEVTLGNWEGYLPK